MSRRALRPALTLIALLASTAAQAQPLPEYTVKAAYLYKFAPFVEWRSDAFSSPNAPLQICVVGDDPFGPVLDQALAGQALGSRPMQVRRLATAAKGSGCHIMYVAGSRQQSAGEALRIVRGDPVLTVTDGAGQAAAKGAIHFVVMGSRVRFEIDSDSASANGLSISSKLKSLALSVRGR